LSFFLLNHKLERSDHVGDFNDDGQPEMMAEPNRKYLYMYAQSCPKSITHVST